MMIKIDDSPNIVDLKLTKDKKSNYGLYNFAYSLLEMKRRWSSDIYRIGKKRIHWVDFWKEEKERFEKLKSHIIFALDDHFKRTGFWDSKAFGTVESKIDYIVGKYELDSFLKVIDKKINEFEVASMKPRKKGAPLQLKSKIALLWSLVIKESRGTDWRTIAGLIDWFASKLSNSSLGKELKGKSADIHSDYLKRQLLSVKNKENYKKDYEEILSKLKNDYFPTKRKNPVFLINFCRPIRLYWIDYLIEDIEYYLKRKKFRIYKETKPEDFKIDLIDYYSKSFPDEI